MLKNNGFLWQTKFSKIYYQFLLNTKEFRKSEYIDFYNYGFERSLYNAGFYEVSNYKKQLIIPDLFGPFIKKIMMYSFLLIKKQKKIFKFLELMVIKICQLINKDLKIYE